MKKNIISSVLFVGILFLISNISIINNKEAIQTMKLEKNNSTTLNKALESQNFKEENYYQYTEINYIDKENFINNINTLLALKYTTTEINDIFQNVNDKNISKILESPKLDLKNYYTIKNFEVEKIPRYEEYQQKNNCSLEEAVLKVNIGLDHNFYSEIHQATELNNYTVLVNKYNSLGNYEPQDLKSLSYNSKYQLRERAANAFEELISFAKLENVYIRPYSAYRSYEYQNTLYNKYVEKDGQELADTYSARPGHSEHQTGLAVDVWSEGYNYISENDAYWLQNNSYKYGFIIRYTQENQSITGYIAEPWHLRYVGKDIAEDIVDKNITFDEYYDLYLKN